MTPVTPIATRATPIHTDAFYRMGKHRFPNFRSPCNCKLQDRRKVLRIGTHRVVVSPMAATTAAQPQAEPLRVGVLSGMKPLRADPLLPRGDDGEGERPHVSSDHSTKGGDSNSGGVSEANEKAERRKHGGDKLNELKDGAVGRGD